MTFEEAATAFADPLAHLYDDPDHSDEEQRFLLVGRSLVGRVLVWCTLRIAIQSASSALAWQSRASAKTTMRNEYHLKNGRSNAYAARLGAKGLRSVIMIAFLVLPARALACGASVGGVAGVSACSLEEHEEEVRKKWRVGVGGSYTSTAIRFGDKLTLDEAREVVLGVVDYRLSRIWTLEAGGGALVAGHLGAGGTVQRFSPGFVATVGASWRVLDANVARPVVLLTSQAAFVSATTHDASGGATTGYQAFDLRLGGLAGWPIANVLTPYALARVFGGPVFWHFQGANRTGTDTHHYQLGAGLSLLIARRVDVFLEGVPLGELALSAGAGVAL